MTDQSPSGYQTSYQHLCATLRELVTEAVQAGRRAAGGLGSTPGRAVATLYLILLQHPVDRYGRCRSCRRPGAILGGRRRRCRVHGEARFWLHQSVDFLRAHLARELDLHAGQPPAPDPTSARPERRRAPTRALDVSRAKATPILSRPRPVAGPEPSPAPGDRPAPQHITDEK